MATKQARELVPGDIVSIDGCTRVTVARTYPTFSGSLPMIGIEWTNGQVSRLRPYDLITVTHANTIGGAL